MKKNIFLIILLFTLAMVVFLLTKDQSNSKIKILDEITLTYPKKNRIEFSGISDIAYDKEKKQLYLLGDRSNIFTLSATFKEKIGELKYLSAHKILNDHKDRYKLYSYDTEGLTFTPQKEILVAHERVAGILEITPTAKIKKRLTLPKKLQPNSNYRNRNKMLESIAYHPKHGLLVASEFPLRGDDINYQTIYSLKGEEWHFTLKSHKEVSVTSIEVMDDGNLLVLERSFNGIFSPMRMILNKLYLDDCDENNNCKVEELLSFNSFKGDGVNNFEGLTRVSKHRYLMVSDNDGYRLLPTKLIYFEVTPPQSLLSSLTPL